MSELSYSELGELLDWAEENLGECLAQYRSEVSLYGDAWPGAAVDIQNQRNEVARLRRELHSRPEYIPAAASNYPDIDY